MPKPNVTKNKSLHPTDRRELVRAIRTALLDLKFEEKAWLFYTLLSEHAELEPDRSTTSEAVSKAMREMMLLYFNERPLGYEPKKGTPL